MKHLTRLSFLLLIVCAAFFACSDDDGGPAGVTGGGGQGTWQTAFEDNFNSTTRDPNWLVLEGDSLTNYQLTGTRLAVDDSPGAVDGPLFAYNGTIGDARIKLTCKVTTEAMTGDVEFIALLRATSPLQTYVLSMDPGDITIVKVLGGLEVLANSLPLATMAANETRLIEGEFNNGTITFTVKNAGGTTLGSVTLVDPSPLPGASVGFLGEIDGMTAEWLYLDDFKVERFVP